MPYVRDAGLAGFWDDLYRVGGAVAGIAQTVQRGAVAGREVQSGNAQVTVVPTRQGITNYVTDRAPTAFPFLLAGAAVMALVLSTSGAHRRRR